MISDPRNFSSAGINYIISKTLHKSSQRYLRLCQSDLIKFASEYNPVTDSRSFDEFLIGFDLVSLVFYVTSRLGTSGHVIYRPRDLLMGLGSILCVKLNRV